MKLKVCGMRDLINVRSLIRDVSPDWIGLIFYPKSPRFVGTKHAEALKQVAVKKAGVFVNAPLEYIAEITEAFGLETVQLHGEESPEFVKELKIATRLEVFKVFPVEQQINWQDLRPFLPFVDFFLFDTFTKDYGGSGQTFNWKILLDYPFEKPFLLSGGIGLINAEEIRVLKGQIPQMAGVDVNSRFEIEPGLKDIETVKKFKEMF